MRLVSQLALGSGIKYRRKDLNIKTHEGYIMTDLLNAVTTKDMKIIIGGRTLAQITELSLSGEAGLADVGVLSEGHKRWKRTKQEYSGSMDVRVDDPALIGLVLGDLEVDPTFTEKPLDISFNGINITQKYIQGDKTNGQLVSTGEKIAQKFRAGGAELTTAQVYVNSGTDASVTVSIQADVTGSPSGTPLDSDTIDCSSTGWKTASLDVAVLTKDDWYWIVLEDSTDVTFAYADADIYDDWGYKHYSGTWGALQANDISFQIVLTDSSSYLHIELTDGVTIHTIKGNLNVGKYALSITSEEPLVASIDLRSDELIFSEV